MIPDVSVLICIHHLKFKSLMSHVIYAIVFSGVVSCATRLSSPDTPRLVISSEYSDESSYEHKVSSTTENLKEIAKWYTGSADNWEVLAVYNGKRISKGVDSYSKLADGPSIKKGEVIYIPSEMLTRTEKFKGGKERVKRSDSRPIVTPSPEIASSQPDEGLEADLPEPIMDLDELSTIEEVEPVEEYNSGIPLDSGAVSEANDPDKAAVTYPTTINPDGEPSAAAPSKLNRPDSIRESERIRLLRELLLQ